MKPIWLILIAVTLGLALALCGLASDQASMDYVASDIAIGGHVDDLGLIDPACTAPRPPMVTTTTNETNTIDPYEPVLEDPWKQTPEVYRRPRDGLVT